MNIIYPSDAPYLTGAQITPPADRRATATLDGPVHFLYRRPSTPKPVAFTLTAAAVEEMDGAWVKQNGGYGNREVGGWLLAHRSAPDHIFAATDATVESRHQSMTMESLHSIEDKFPPHLFVCGSWHTHPEGSEGIPSMTDQRSSYSHLAHLLEGRDDARTLDVIGVPRGNGSLALHGWSTRLRAGIAYRAKTEPARIEVVW